MKKPAKKSTENKKNAPPVGTSSLSPRTRLFCQYYLKLNNATQAAKKAGFSESGASVQGTRLMADPKVQKHIKYLQQKIARKLTIDVETVAQELGAIAFANIAEFVKIGKDGSPRPLKLGKLTQVQKAAIKKIGKDGQVELHEKTKALEMLAKYLGMWKDGGLNAGDIGDQLTAAKQRAADRQRKDTKAEPTEEITPQESPPVDAAFQSSEGNA